MLLQAFVAWHLSLGASEVILYFDRPDDPAADDLKQVPMLRAIPCDTRHWRRLGFSRPHRHQSRQVHNANDAYRQLSVDWVLHCDADEFIWAERPVSDCLDTIPDDVPSCVVPVAERAFPAGPAAESIFSGVFRRPFVGRPVLGRKLFGPGYAMTQRGLTGHAIGKSFVRTRQGVSLSIHRPKPKGDDPLRADRAVDLTLLHFDGLTPVHWIYKVLRKANDVMHNDGQPASRHRQRQIEAVLAQPNDAVALHDRLKRLDAAQQAALSNRDLLVRVPFSPGASSEAVFGQRAKCFAPKTVDAWLWSEKAEVLHRFGLRQE